MLDAAATEALMRSFMLGTARQPAPIARALGGAVDAAADKAPLQALALLAQHRRFTRRWSHEAEAPKPAFEDSRALPPAAARPVMIALLSGKNGSADDPLACAIADALDRRRMKVHPFDLPRLEAFAKLHVEKLGAGALAWVNRQAGAEDDRANPYFFEKIDASNWRQAWRSQKAVFIREQRRLDAAGARDLVAAAFASEPAPVRVALLKALGTGLSAADAPFLQTLSGDRAPSVREAAEALLGRLPGSEPAARRLAEVIGRIKVAKTGLLRRGRELTLDYPATLSPFLREGWAFGAFAQVSLDALALGLDMRAEDMAKSVADAVLALALAALAIREGRFSVLATLGEKHGNLWPALERVEEADLDERSAAALAAVLVRPADWSEMPMAGQWARLHAVMRFPLAAQLFKSILASKAWHALPRDGGENPGAWTSSTLTALAALAPASERAAYRAELRSFSPALTGRASQGLALLDLIDTA